MASMTDPTDGMVSFQQALLNGEIDLRPGELDPNLFVHADNPAPGVARITYVRLDRQTVKPFASIVATERMEGCSPSAPMRQIEGLHEGRISGSS